MASKKCWIIISLVIVGLAIAAGLAVLITWLVRRAQPDYTIIYLDGEGIGDIPQEFAYTRLRRGAHIFWWFYPTTQTESESRPIILWLDGLLGLPPSLLANFGMFGPYDFNLNRRENSWVSDYNLLFVDAPVGTGFSFFNQDSQVASTPEEYAEDLFFTLQSFYSINEEYKNTPLYIVGQGHGAKQAVALATRLQEALHDDQTQIKLEGIILGGAIISPALVMTRLGFYLEELGYIDGNGRAYIEELSADTLSLVNEEKYEEALSNFISLEDSLNERAGAVAVNIHHIVEKITREPTTGSTGYFNQRMQLQRSVPEGVNINVYMDETVGPALGISRRVAFDELHADAVDASRATFMKSDVEKVENILNNTEVNVYIYNGNLDAVTNTPGQLEWVNRLRWSGQDDFVASPRRLIVANGLLEGYVRETDRLHFYWINVAGHSVPLDNPVAIRQVLRRITGY